MTEAEARHQLHADVATDTGLIALLERTGEIPPDRVAAFYESLDVLALGWRNRQAVPKPDLLLLVDLPHRIYEAAQHAARHGEQIENLSVEMGMRIATLLGYHPDPRTVDGAEQLLEEGFSSKAGLPFLLHMRLPYASSDVEEMYIALDTLEEAWQTRGDIPIRLACVMFDVREAVNSVAGLYPERQEEIEAIGDKLSAKVRRLLS